MKVFISYGNIADQVTALRLQALAAVNGLTVFVPPAYTRQVSASMDEDVVQKLKEAEVVLGLVETGLSPSCQEELNFAIATGKKMIVLCAPQFAPRFEPTFQNSLVVIDPFNPDQASIETVRHLRQMESEKTGQKTLIGIGLLAVGLLVAATNDRS